jgi:hypothetical protein
MIHRLQLKVQGKRFRIRESKNIGLGFMNQVRIDGLGFRVYNLKFRV